MCEHLHSPGCKGRLVTQLLRTGECRDTMVKGLAGGDQAALGWPWSLQLGRASVLICPPLSLCWCLISLGGQAPLSWRKGRVQENFLRGVRAECQGVLTLGCGACEE